MMHSQTLSEALVSGGNRQQKTPSGWDGVQERVKGVEPGLKLVNSERNGGTPDAGGANAALDAPQLAQESAELRAVIAAWPALAQPFRAAIMAIVTQAR
jgi:hypothetical protein